MKLVYVFISTSEIIICFSVCRMCGVIKRERDRARARALTTIVSTHRVNVVSKVTGLRVSFNFLFFFIYSFSKKKWCTREAVQVCGSINS